MKKIFSLTSQHGNALWFILIAIVLLGGLTMLLTRSGSNVTQSGDVEQIRVKASQIMRWAKGLETAIDKMKMNGISETQISFDNDVTLENYDNPNCNKPACMVFGEGGGMAYLKPPPGVNNGAQWMFLGTANVGSASYPVGTTAPKTGADLIVVLKGVTDAFCIQINKDLGIGTAGTIPIETIETQQNIFTGTFETAEYILDGDDTLHELDGHNTGCYFDDADGSNFFYYVLLAR